jgi:pimeloyl-ACP methyl ester carboxylesterase
MRLTFDRGGDGDRLLVFLHGMGATRHVWQSMIAANRWRGAWLAPDLRGHGASPHAEGYTLADHATDVAETIRSAGTWKEIVFLGHSMGGAIALKLSSGKFGFTPSVTYGLGIKVAWSESELARLIDLAAAPPRTFATEAEAIARYLKVSGLDGLIDEHAAAAKAGVTRTAIGWRLANDPRSALVGRPPIAELLAAAKAPLHLACGANDRLVTRDQLRAFDAHAVELEGLGHNAMVESPAAVWDWIESFDA